MSLEISSLLHFKCNITFSVIYSLSLLFSSGLFIIFPPFGLRPLFLGTTGSIFSGLGLGLRPLFFLNYF